MEQMQKVRSDLISIENVLSSDNIGHLQKLKRIKELINSVNVKMELLNDGETTQETQTP